MDNSREARPSVRAACWMVCLSRGRCPAHLGVDADGLVALLAGISEDRFVALNAVGVVIAQHVALASQRLVALPAAEVARMPVLGHGLGVLATENQLKHNATVPRLALREFDTTHA